MNKLNNKYTDNFRIRMNLIEYVLLQCLNFLNQSLSIQFIKQMYYGKYWSFNLKGLIFNKQNYGIVDIGSLPWLVFNLRSRIDSSSRSSIDSFSLCSSLWFVLVILCVLFYVCDSLWVQLWQSLISTVPFLNSKWNWWASSIELWSVWSDLMCW